MSEELADVVLCICTRSRPEKLDRALQSLSRHEWPDGWQLLVVDNDCGRSAEEVTYRWRSTIGLPVTYTVEPEVGFASVRNAALALCADASAVCFFDDDAIAGPSWAARMHDVHERNPLALVQSRVYRVPEIPQTRDGIAHLFRQLAIAPDPNYSGTNGLLVPITTLGGRRFNTRFNLTGGEDTDLIMRLNSAGAQTIQVHDAILIDEGRHSPNSVKDTTKVGFRSGRQYAEVLYVNGVNINRPRARSLVGVPIAALLSLASFTLGRREEALGQLRKAAARAGVLTVRSRNWPSGSNARSPDWTNDDGSDREHGSH